MKNGHALRAFTLLILAFIFNGCTSGNTGNLNLSKLGPSPSPSPSPSTTVSNFQTGGGGWDLCCTLTGGGDSMACPTPKSNCFDEIVATPKNLALLNEAIDKRTTRTFFGGDEWRKVFPDLDKFPKQLEMLRDGLPLLRFESETKGLVRYVATRQTREEILRQTHGKEQKPIAGVEFALPVREER
jgi:hypothetical protein